MKRKVWDITVKDNPNRVVMGENDDFYTTDTEAYLVFNLQDKEFSPTTANLTMHNRSDGSVFNRDVPISNNKIEYELDAEEIIHAGIWQGQLVYELDKAGYPEKYTSGEFNFDIKSHLLDKKEPTKVIVENWNNFTLVAEGLIDDWEAFEMIRQSNEDERVVNEITRVEAEVDRLENEGIRVQAENERTTAEVLRQEQFVDMQLTKDLDRNINFKTTLEIKDSRPRLRLEEI